MTGESVGRRLLALVAAAAVLCGLVLVPASPASAQTGVMIQPVSGRVTGVLSNRCGSVDSDHYGVDIAGNSGMAIGAAYPGTVAFAGWTSGGGNMVTLNHASGYQTRYLHMVQQPSVAVGQQVGQGQLLGYVGSTGNSTGPHLHFEIRRNGAVHDIAPAYSCGGTVTKGAPINLPFADLGPANGLPDRFAFVNAAGVVFAKDGAYSSWQGLNSGGASRVVLSGNWIGWLEGGNFYAKDGIYGPWITLAGGGQVRDIAISGDRFAFVNAAGVVFAKDGAYSSWQGLNGGGASRVVLSGNWIGWVQGGNFYAKDGVYAQWITLAGGGQVRDIAISGSRFAFVNAAGVVFAKDGAYSSWQGLNSGGASRVVLSGNWIGWVQGGNFYAKDGIYAQWITLAEGGQVSDIAVSAEGWFAFVGGGNFYAKQGVYAGWLTMSGGGQVRNVAVTT